MSAPYSLLPQIGGDARLGVIVLSADETLEAELRDALPDGDIALFTSRIASGAEVSTESLAAMEAHLPSAARLLPDTINFDVVAYACTSAASVIGSAAVAKLILSACTAAHVIDPVSALVARCRAQGISRLALLSPYTADVNASLRDALSEQGIDTPVFASFNEPVETRVARIDPQASLAAALDLAKDTSVDGVFLSCTNLRTAPILQKLRAQSGKPAMSSNSVLFEQMFHLSGLTRA